MDIIELGSFMLRLLERGWVGCVNIQFPEDGIELGSFMLGLLGKVVPDILEVFCSALMVCRPSVFCSVLVLRRSSVLYRDCAICDAWLSNAEYMI